LYFDSEILELQSATQDHSLSLKIYEKMP